MTGLGYRVRRQQPFGPYYLDFYIKALMLAIEVDGNIHEGKREHDQVRDAWLQKQGITLIRIHARFIFSNVSDVVEMLQARINDIDNSQAEG